MRSDTHAIDASLKALFREAPAAILRLAGAELDPREVCVQDSAVNLPELRTDHLFLLGPVDNPRCGIHLEYQLYPSDRELPNWFAKCAVLNRQFGVPVSLLVVYLRKGRRRRFPDRITLSAVGITTEFRFTTVRLWEHASLIESGEIPELAPLLVLCEDRPNERTIRKEIDVIRTAAVDTRTRSDLMAIAMRIASRQFPRSLLLEMFRQEVPTMKGSSIIDDWIAEGKAEGKVEGKVEGKTETARDFARSILTKRFGVLPFEIGRMIDTSSAEWCARLVDRALEIESISQLRLPEQR